MKSYKSFFWAAYFFPTVILFGTDSIDLHQSNVELTDSVPSEIAAVYQRQWQTGHTRDAFSDDCEHHYNNIVYAASNNMLFVLIRPWL